MREEHLEDVPMIPPTEFGELSLVAREIRNGNRDPIKVAQKCKVALSEMSEMMSGKFNSLYESTMANILEEKLKEAIASKNDLTANGLIELAKKYSRDYAAEMPEPVTDMSERYIMELDARRQRDIVNTGLAPLDELLYGIKTKELTAIGARPSTGKSAFVQMVATNVARNGRKVMFFPLEMTPEQLRERNIMRFSSGISQKAIRSGSLSEAQWQEVANVSQMLDEWERENMVVVENVRSIEVIEQLIKKHKPFMVVIDQLQQLQTSKPMQTVRERFGYMTNNLKRIAMEQGCAVWLACQLNRNAKEQSLPTMDYLKEAGNIEEDSDNVILLWRNEKAEEDFPNLRGNRIVNIGVEKQRMGPIGRFDTLMILQRFSFKALEDESEQTSGFEQMRTDDVPF